MRHALNILIIDDHPLILDSYKRSFEYCFKDTEHLEIIFTEAADCGRAVSIIQEFHKLKKIIDFVILDIRLPEDESKKYVSGEDIGALLKALFPKTKLIISTSIDSSYRIQNIIKTVNPDGFLIKGDLTPTELINAIRNVFQGDTYYSKTVITYLRKTVASNILIDSIDRKLLYELSTGTRMKDLPEVLNLSKAAIEKRKRNLKVVFDIESTDDKELLEAAKKHGFI